MLAGAEMDRAVFLGRVGYGGETGALVRPVAKRLRFALATGAPVVGLAIFDSDSDGGSLSDFWFVHFDVGLFSFRSQRTISNAERYRISGPSLGTFSDPT